MSNHCCPSSVSSIPTALAGTAFVAVCIAVLLGSCADSAPPPAPLRPVKFAVVASASGNEARSFPASVQPRDATQLSFRVGGNLARLTVNMGETVTSGQLIARLDQADYRVAVAQAQANFQSAKTARDTAQSSFRRVETLFEAGSTSQSEYENAKGQLNSAQAQLDAARQQVKQARNQLEYTELRAPFAGVVNSVAVRAGEQISAGKPVVVVSKGGALEVNAQVSEGFVSRIQVGTRVQVTVTAVADEPQGGTVREVGFTSENSTYPVLVELDAIPPALRPGMAAEARFALVAQSSALVVPAPAVANSEAGPFVFLLVDRDRDRDRDRDNDQAGNRAGAIYIVRKTQITLGQLRDDHFEVTEGLKAGDKVATAGLTNLVDGLEVRLLESRGARAERKSGAETQP